MRPRQNVIPAKAGIYPRMAATMEEKSSNRQGKDGNDDLAKRIYEHKEQNTLG